MVAIYSDPGRPIVLEATQWYNTPVRVASTPCVTGSTNVLSVVTKLESIGAPSMNQLMVGVGSPLALQCNTRLPVNPCTVWETVEETTTCCCGSVVKEGGSPSTMRKRECNYTVYYLVLSIKIIVLDS